MTLNQALDTGLNIYANYGDSTVHIDKYGSVYIVRELSNGKTEWDWYAWYTYAMKKHPLDKLNWHVKEN
jgi:hypothetical protein